MILQIGWHVRFLFFGFSEGVSLWKGVNRGLIGLFLAAPVESGIKNKVLKIDWGGVKKMFQIGVNNPWNRVMKVCWVRIVFGAYRKDSHEKRSDTVTYNHAVASSPAEPTQTHTHRAKSAAISCKPCLYSSSTTPTKMNNNIVKSFWAPADKNMTITLNCCCTFPLSCPNATSWTLMRDGKCTIQYSSSSSHARGQTDDWPPSSCFDRRYVWILNSLLSGSMKINASPLFLHCIILHGIPNLDAAGGSMLGLHGFCLSPNPLAPQKRIQTRPHLSNQDVGFLSAPCRSLPSFSFSDTPACSGREGRLRQQNVQWPRLQPPV